MTKQIGWLVIALVVIAGLGWWLNKKDDGAVSTTTGTQTSQPATASEAAVSGDLKAADQAADSIDFTNDFSSADLDSLAK